MNTEIKQQWLKALRSGDYLQCKNALRIGCRFCVIGVLCDLHHKTMKEVNWVLEPGGGLLLL